MQDSACPPPKFQRFEKVLVASRRLGDRLVGQRGTVIWCDLPWFDGRTERWAEWGYAVSFPDLKSYSSFLESDLLPTGEFDSEESHLGIGYEISYDTVVSDDMGNLEGCYRIPGRLWQVFFFQNDDVPELRHNFGTWRSGI